jgi:hypothetical protein
MSDKPSLFAELKRRNVYVGAAYAVAAWLLTQIAFDNHDTGTLILLIDPLLRDDPRYKNLVVKVGLPTVP